jgi:hypothetical protein
MLARSLYPTRPIRTKIMATKDLLRLGMLARWIFAGLESGFTPYALADGPRNSPLTEAALRESEQNRQEP